MTSKTKRKSHKPKWNPRAQKRLQELVLTIAEESPAAARKLATEIREKVNLLPQQPRIYKKCPQDLRYREMVIRPNFKVIYRIDDIDQVEVMTVVHSRQAWENLEES